eukprot:14761898-Heterocapsa_arctica.AAC.1
MQRGTQISRGPKLELLEGHPYCQNNWGMMSRFVVTMNTVWDAAEVQKPNILKRLSMFSGEGKFAIPSSD